MTNAGPLCSLSRAAIQLNCSFVAAISSSREYS
jgi:hypothetical protein